MFEHGRQLRRDAARPLALTDWSSRTPTPTVAEPAELAARIEAALDRADLMLFTVTPREELDAVAGWQRLADQAWCGQLRHVVASTSRMSSDERDFAGDELALALGLSPVAGRALVWEYGAIAALPGLVEAVESGRLSARHVTAVVRVLDETPLSLEQRQAVVLIALARYVDQTPSAWADLVRRLVLTIDPQAARRRRDEQAARRRADFYPRPDQQGALWLQAPVELVAAAQARVEAEARRLKAQGDPRTMEQLGCDVALALLTEGVLDGRPVAPFDVQVVTPLSVLEGGDLEIAEIPGWGPLLPSTARDLAAQAAAFTQVGVAEDGQVITVSDRLRADRLRAAAADVAVGGEQPAEGVAPDASHCADDVARAEPKTAASADTIDAAGAPSAPGAPEFSDRFLTLAVAAMRQPPVRRELRSSGYRPGPRLTRFVQARDRTCVFPGCRQPAQRTDLDHRDPWPRGRTDEHNLQCLCRHHHRAKHAVFTVEREPDGTLAWTTRGGWVFRRRPWGW